MHVVIVHDGARLNPERVNPSHVRSHKLPNRMDVVKANVIVMCATRAVAPGPADRDSGLVEIKDVVVLDGVVRRVPDPDSHGPRM